MKSFIFNTLYSFVTVVLKPYVQNGFFDRTEELVISMLKEDMTGDEKRAKVYEWLITEYQEINNIFINFAIELAVVKVVKPE